MEVGYVDEGAHLDAWRLHVEEEVADATVLWGLGIGPGDNEHPVGTMAVACPDLLAVDDIVVAVLHGVTLQRGQVGACSRLAEALAPVDLAAGDSRQVPSLVLFGAADDDGGPHHV